jgi:tetratricopeptide (TPR) repeat protein
MRKNNSAGSKITLKRKIALIISGLVLSIIILEIGLRITNGILSASQEYWNRVSLRGKGVYRILCLGESTTARQYPQPLEKILNERNTGIKFKVIDKGVIATNTSGILSQLGKNLDLYRPDMVITMMGYNDKWIMYYKDIPESNTGLFRYSRAYRLFRLMCAYISKKLKKEDVYSLNPGISNVRFGPAYTELGDNYRQHGDLVNAEKVYKKAIKCNSGDAMAYYGLARIYCYQGNWDAGEKAFKKAIELNHQNYAALSRLGEMYRNQLKMSEAEEYLKRAIEANPGNYEAYTEMGCVYRYRDDLSTAEKYFNRARELQPDSEWTCAELVQVYKRQNNFKEAENALKRYIADNPANEWGYRILESLYKEMGRDGAAEECGRKRKGLNKDEYPAAAIRNYNQLKLILDGKKIRFVCMQYPMRSVEPLKGIFDDPEGIIFVDNSRVFAEAVKKGGYKAYFNDMFGGDFGHCTDRGNELMAENIAEVILKEARFK